MKIKKFEEINESSEIKMDYFEAFEQFIKGKRVLSYYSVPAYGDYNLEFTERFYGDGIAVEGNYKMIHHGGGCSGDDCNSSFIVSPDDKLIARHDW